MFSSMGEKLGQQLLDQEVYVIPQPLLFLSKPIIFTLGHPWESSLHVNVILNVYQNGGEKTKVSVQSPVCPAQFFGIQDKKVFQDKKVNTFYS